MMAQHRHETPPESTANMLATVQEPLLARLQQGEQGPTDAVDFMLCEAVKRRASDVHLEPWGDAVSLRYRIDGILHEAALLPAEHQHRMVARIKILAKMVIYQKDMPQDGRIEPEATSAGKPMRVSTMPTVNGEKVVVRILEPEPSLYALDALGFGDGVAAQLRALVRRPQGTVLLTGPSSSGKTTTIYSLLREIQRGAAAAPHIVTVEDPVEYRLGRVAQTQVNPAAGFTFEQALRALLRQDPEVIMVGEIRDPETARVAVQAGLTGHLVISTIHSGTAAGVFTRLLDMAIEPYLVSSSVTGVLAQRLLRKTCPSCAEPYEPDPALLRRYGVADGEFRRGAGCAQCDGIGFLGRTAIGELLRVNEEIAELVLGHPRTAEVQEAALASGMTRLARDGARRVAAGDTTVEELARVLPPPEEVHA